ncbi:MHO_1580 family protein, partial [Mycoplasmopsis bovis]|uniref:MHO_1580 family protein n=1 Tax=Mycoplasmopsis bovis TaxID=28903 RepID=UPI003D2653DF
SDVRVITWSIAQPSPVLVTTLTSDYLGLSFEDLENIVVTFPMDSWRTAHGHNYDFWEVKFDKLQNKNKTINAVNNHAVKKFLSTIDLALMNLEEP